VTPLAKVTLFQVALPLTLVPPCPWHCRVNWAPAGSLPARGYPVPGPERTVTDTVVLQLPAAKLGAAPGDDGDRLQQVDAARASHRPRSCCRISALACWVSSSLVFGPSGPCICFVRARRGSASMRCSTRGS
jgi:hypothetical protein